jgi:hypothetical protein
MDILIAIGIKLLDVYKKQRTYNKFTFDYFNIL